MRLPQELFAEALWLEWFLHYGNVCEEKLPDLLRRYNLKLKKKKTLDDVKLALGRAFKNTPCVSSKQIEQEWDLAKAFLCDKYGKEIADFVIKEMD